MYRTTDEYERRIDRLLIYLGRYGRQDAVAMQNVPTATLLSWADRVHEFLEEERKQMEDARR